MSEEQQQVLRFAQDDNVVGGAIVTTGSRPAPFRIPVRHGGKAGLILLDQIRAVDKVRLVKRSGVVSLAVLKSTLLALAEVFED